MTESLTTPPAVPGVDATSLLTAMIRVIVESGDEPDPDVHRFENAFGVAMPLLDDDLAGTAVRVSPDWIANVFYSDGDPGTTHLGVQFVEIEEAADSAATTSPDADDIVAKLSANGFVPRSWSGEHDRRLGSVLDRGPLHVQLSTEGASADDPSRQCIRQIGLRWTTGG